MNASARVTWRVPCPHNSMPSPSIAVLGKLIILTHYLRILGRILYLFPLCLFRPPSVRSHLTVNHPKVFPVLRASLSRHLPLSTFGQQRPTLSSLTARALIELIYLIPVPQTQSSARPKLTPICFRLRSLRNTVKRADPRPNPPPQHPTTSLSIPHNRLLPSRPFFSHILV